MSQPFPNLQQLPGREILAAKLHCFYPSIYRHLDRRKQIFLNLSHISNKIQAEIYSIQSYPQADCLQKHRVFWVFSLPNTPIFRHQLPFSWHTPSLSDLLHMLLPYSSVLRDNRAPLQSQHLRLCQLLHLQSPALKHSQESSLCYTDSLYLTLNLSELQGA